MNLQKYVLTFAVCLATASFAFGQTVTTGVGGSGLFGGLGDLIIANADEAGFGDDAESLTQTFRPESGISLSTFAISYEYDGNATAPAPNTLPVTIEFFEVADTLAEMLTPGTSLLNFTFPVGSFPDNGENAEALFTLDTPLALAASAGTEGYGFRISGGTESNRGFEWNRTGSTANSTYAPGEAYDNDGTLLRGGTAPNEREFALVFNPVHVPGDFDYDGDADVDDIDLLSAEFDAEASTFPIMDVETDGTINLADHDAHITTQVMDANGTGALIGDLNFDGDVDVSQIVVGAGGVQNFGDASVLLANLGTETGALYGDGDLNGDGDVDVSEIVIGAGGVQNLGDASRLLANLGQNTAAPGAAAVPEPGSTAVLAFLGMGVALRRRK